MIAITSPFTNFFDTNGSPLNNGRVYFGVVATNPVIPSNQIPIYWDSEMTQPAAQPVVVLNGLIHRSGTPAQLFTNVGYSISVYDNRNRLLYYSPYGQKGGVLDFSLELSGENGSSMIGFIQSGTGAVYRKLQDKARELFSPLDFGAKGDGATYDDAAFLNLESKINGSIVNLVGRTYLLTAYPVANKYTGGLIKIGGSVFLPNGDAEIKTLNKNVSIGRGAGQSLPNQIVDGPGTSNIHIGENSGRSNSTGRYNISMGEDSLYSVDGGAGNEGTRNIAFGGNSSRFLTTGNSNINIGRNAGQCATTGSLNTAIGTNTHSGRGSLKFAGDGKIVNQTPSTASQATSLGANSAFFGAVQNLTSVGAYSARNIKQIDTGNTAIGVDAMRDVGINTSVKGKVQTTVNLSGTFSMSVGQVVFSLPGHGLSAGWEVVTLIPNPGTSYSDPQYYTISSADANTFTVNEPDAVDGYSGTFTLESYATLVDAVPSKDNFVAGLGAMAEASGSSNAVIGLSSLRLASNAQNVVAIGSLTARNVPTATLSQAIGNGAAQNAGSLLSSVCIGSASAGPASSINESVFVGRQSGDATGAAFFRCTGIGAYSLRLMQDGSVIGALNNAVGIGANTRVSSSDQIQLGTNGITTYAYGAVQDRSDIRDKTSVRDTVLGLDFIKALRPVDFKWDMRDDYVREIFPEEEAPKSPDIPEAPLVPSMTEARKQAELFFDEKTDVSSHLIQSKANQIIEAAQASLADWKDENEPKIEAHKLAMEEWKKREEKRSSDSTQWFHSPAKDGSKTRNRFHHGLIAQEVQAVIEKTGIDFGGFQNHAVNGGCDVLSIGYTELIGPLIKAVQQLSERLENAEEIIAQLNGG